MRGNEPDGQPERCYAFFRDLSCGPNLLLGRTFNAAGIVVERHGSRSGDGRDLTVMYINPFTAGLAYAWRRDNDVELFPVSYDEWALTKRRYERMGLE